MTNNLVFLLHAQKKLLIVPLFLYLSTILCHTSCNVIALPWVHSYISSWLFVHVSIAFMHKFSKKKKKKKSANHREKAVESSYQPASTWEAKVSCAWQLYTRKCRTLWGRAWASSYYGYMHMNRLSFTLKWWAESLAFMSVVYARPLPEAISNLACIICTVCE